MVQNDLWALNHLPLFCYGCQEAQVLTLSLEIVPFEDW